MKLAMSSEMRELDRTAIEKYHIPGMVLMENAGHGTFNFMVRELGPVTGRSVIIFAGPGNNGGDGLVIARHVHQSGGFPFVVYMVPPDKLKGDAALNYSIVKELDLPSKVVHSNDDFASIKKIIKGFGSRKPIWSIVDALFGTGLKRMIEGRFLSAIKLINRLHDEYDCPVTAVDIPSGMDADNGQVLGYCVQADLTATYGLAKPAHFMHGGAGLIGKLHIVNIGIPPEAVNNSGIRGKAIESDIILELGPRKTASHKGSYGHLLILAGSEGKTGAAILSAKAALRIGSGLVTLAVPRPLNTIFESSLTEAMTIALPGSKTYLSVENIDLIHDQVAGKNAVVIGPGLSTRKKTQDLVVELYREIKVPMVVDADALNILSANLDVIADPPAPRILTPHPGEMARLTGHSTGKIQDDRLKTSLSFIKKMNRRKTNVTLVLKGAGTLVVDPQGSWAINTTGNAGMASGGMGDVLTGLIAGLIAQSIPPGPAARLAVYIHGLAADRLAEQKIFGYLAADVANNVPVILNEFVHKH